MTEIDRGKEGDLIVALRNRTLNPYQVASGDISARVALQMVREDGSSIQLIPKELRDHEIYRQAILSGGDSALTYIDSDLINPGVDYDDMTFLQQQVADAIETRSDWEFNVRQAREGDTRGLAYIPEGYHNSLIDRDDILAFADSGGESWLQHINPSLFDRFEEGGALRITDLAYQVMARNPNLIRELIENGVVDKENQEDLNTVRYLVSEALDESGSSIVSGSYEFQKGIEDFPAGVWDDDLFVKYVKNSADPSEEMATYEEYTGRSLSNISLAQIAIESTSPLHDVRFNALFNTAAKEFIKDPESLGAVKRFAIEVDMGERSDKIRSTVPGDDEMVRYAEAFLKEEMDNGDRDELNEMLWDEGLRLDAEKNKENTIESSMEIEADIGEVTPEFNYKESALRELLSKGITPEWLIENHPNEIGRLSISVSMGDEDGFELRSSEPGEHRLLPAAEAWINAATQWPPRAEIYGIELKGRLESSITENIISGDEWLHHVPYELQTEEMRIAAVRLSADWLEYIDIADHTFAIQSAAIERNPYAIKRIPESHQTEELALLAVQGDGMVLVHLREDLKTEEVLLEAVRQNGMAVELLDNSCEEYYYEDIRVAAVTQNGAAIEYIFPGYYTDEILMAAVKQSGIALEYIHPDYITDELIAARHIPVIESTSIDTEGNQATIIIDGAKVDLFLTNEFEPMFDRSACYGTLQAVGLCDLQTEMVTNAVAQEANRLGLISEIEMNSRISFEHMPKDNASQDAQKNIESVLVDNDHTHSVRSAQDVEALIKSDPATIDSLSKRDLRKLGELDWTVKEITVVSEPSSISLPGMGEGNRLPEPMSAIVTVEPQYVSAKNGHIALENHAEMIQDRLGNLERVGRVDMVSSGGLEVSFDIQSDAAKYDSYSHIDSLRDFYGRSDVSYGEAGLNITVAGRTDEGNALYSVVNAVEDRFYDAADKTLNRLPAEYEHIADVSFENMHTELTARGVELPEYDWLEPEKQIQSVEKDDRSSAVIDKTIEELMATILRSNGRNEQIQQPEVVDYEPIDLDALFADDEFNPPGLKNPEPAQAPHQGVIKQEPHPVIESTIKALLKTIEKPGSSESRAEVKSEVDQRPSKVSSHSEPRTEDGQAFDPDAARELAMSQKQEVEQAQNQPTQSEEPKKSRSM